MDHCGGSKTMTTCIVDTEPSCRSGRHLRGILCDSVDRVVPSVVPTKR